MLVNVLPDSGFLSLAPMEEKPVLLSQSPPPSFGLFSRNGSFSSLAFFLQNKKKVSVLYSRRQEVGLWGLCLLISLLNQCKGKVNYFLQWPLCDNPHLGGDTHVAADNIGR